MGNCCSNTSTDSPPPTVTSRVPQSNGQAFELQPSLPSSVSPRGRDTTSEPAKPVQIVEPITVPATHQLKVETSQKPSRSAGPNLPHKISKARSENPYFDRHPPVSYGESSQTRSPQSGITNPLSSPRYGSRSMSANPLYDTVRNEFLPFSGVETSPPFEEGDQNGAGTAPDSRRTPRRSPSRRNNTKNNTAPFPPTVREVLPDGCRYALRR